MFDIPFWATFDWFWCPKPSKSIPTARFWRARQLFYFPATTGKLENRQWGSVWWLPPLIINWAVASSVGLQKNSQSCNPSEVPNPRQPVIRATGKFQKCIPAKRESCGFFVALRRCISKNRCHQLSRFKFSVHRWSFYSRNIFFAGNGTISTYSNVEIVLFPTKKKCSSYKITNGGPKI